MRKAVRFFKRMRARFGFLRSRKHACGPQRPSRLMQVESLEPRQLLTTLYWDPSDQTGSGMGGSGTWSTSAACWSTNSNGGGTLVPWTNGDTAAFNGTAGTVTLGSSVTVGGMSFNASSGTYAVNGSGSYTLGLSGSCTATATTQATIAAVLSGTGSLTVNGGSTLTLSGNNTSA